MQRLLPLFFLIVFPFCAFAQSGNHCQLIEELLAGSDYKEAYKQLVVNGEYSCGVVTYAKVLKWNDRYQEALEIIKGETSEEAASLERELSELVNPKLPDELYALRPYDKGDSISRRIIAFDHSPIFVSSKEVETSFFPIEEIEERISLSSGQDSSYFFGSILEEFSSRQEKYELKVSGGWISSDSTYYYSAYYKVPLYSQGFHNDFAIYAWDNGKTEILPQTEKKTAYYHPTVMNDKWLIFSSDLEGGYGGFDLWKIDLTTPGSAPINLGSEVNSSQNEIYPTAAGDSLYFATNDTLRSVGGYDILLFAEGLTSNPGKPLNSSNDEMNPYAVGRELAFMVTDRLYPDSLDFVMSVKPFKKRLLFNHIHGEVSEGALAAGERVELLDEQGRLLDYTYLNSDGRFTFTSIKGLESYTISVGENKLSKGDRLAIFNSNYQLIDEIAVDESGMARFELLTPEDYVLRKEKNVDDTFLSVDIMGMYANKSGDTNQGVEIFLQDSQGRTVARAYTDSEGGFVFEQVVPDESYMFQSSVKDLGAEIRIFNQDGEIIETIGPESSGDFVYVRLKESDKIITFTNEQNVSMRIAEDEAFNLPAMYFELDNSRIVEESKVVLSRLEEILRQNEHVTIKLSGHTDSKGKSSYNLALSERRVSTIKQYLVERGVGAQRIEGHGYGETRLVNECADGVECTEEQHAENRRIEIQFYSAEKP